MTPQFIDFLCNPNNVKVKLYNHSQVEAAERNNVALFIETKNINEKAYSWRYIIVDLEKLMNIAMTNEMFNYDDVKITNVTLTNIKGGS